MSTARGDRSSSRNDNATLDNPTSPAPLRGGLSRKKQFAFCAITLILSWLLCEIGTFFLLWLWLGRPFSWAAAQKRAAGPGGPT